MVVNQIKGLRNFSNFEKKNYFFKWTVQPMGLIDHNPVVDALVVITQIRMHEIYKFQNTLLFILPHSFIHLYYLLVAV